MIGAALLSFAVAFSGAFGLPPAAPECDPAGAAVREVRAVATGIIAAGNARDIGRVLGYYAAGAVLMPPGEGAVVGRDAIRKRYEDLFSRFDPRIEAHLDDACADGDLAFVRGRNGGRLVPRQGGEARDLDDAYLMVLRREGDGHWRISHLMWHRAGAPARKEPPR